MKRKRIASLLIVFIVYVLFSQTVVFAENDKPDGEPFYFDEFYKIDDDKGFSLDEKEKIKEKDAHYGWRLGSLYVSGFTQRTEDANGTPVFLKNSGDKVVLGFKLEQDIDKLNGDETLSIASDKKGYDEYFQIKTTDFKRGALIIRHTDYQNAKKEPQLYTDYLSADSEINANTVVELNEEGDYEVALDYVVKRSPRKVFGKEILPTTSDYTIRLFKFSIRNGNSMVFPFDVKTGEELSNKAFTENGFKIDLAKSRYLKVFVRRDVINGEDTEDTRENKPAKDGAVYSEEGIYTITVEDPSTEQITEKKIYVGSDNRYKALVTTGLSLEEIDTRIANGESIGSDGNFISASTDGSINQENAHSEEQNSGIAILPIVVIGIVVFVIAAIVLSRSRKKKIAADNDSEGRNV